MAGGWCTHLEGHTSLFGGPVLPGFLGWTVWTHFGEQTPATPDGRLAGQPLAHSLAPRSGVKVKGFPSVVLSASGLDHSRGLGGITFNVRFGANSLAAEGVGASVVNARFVKPLDGELLLETADKGPIVTVEEGTLAGGFGSAVLEYLEDSGLSSVRVLRLGLPDRFVEQGKRRD